jgi:DNA-binding NarL/FixJ family response regulator
MRIMLVEDHKATREEMRALIEGQPDMRVVVEAETGEDGVARARAERPDVVVMDILLPGMNGIEATRAILKERPEAKVLALSNHFGNVLVRSILSAGGLGYVLKGRAFEELIPALRSVAAGQQYISKVSAEPTR